MVTIELRSTRATFPLQVVCKWLGNAEAVAKRHDLQVTDESFQRAAGDADSETTTGTAGPAWSEADNGE